MRLVPVYLGKATRAIRQPHLSHALEFSPTSAAIQLAEPKPNDRADQRRTTDSASPLDSNRRLIQRLVRTHAVFQSQTRDHQLSEILSPVLYIRTTSNADH